MPMPIDFHCEHCGKLIKAPAAEAGRIGKCPYCDGRTYVPRSEDEGGEIPLAPLDETEERNRQRAAAEDAAIQMKLLREKTRDRDPTAVQGFKRVDQPGRSGATAPASSGGPPASSRKHLTGLIVSYIEAMSSGNLERADKLTSQLNEDRRSAASIVEEMLGEDLTGYGMPSLPRPVLTGFLKQLRTRL